jgi:electron transport complex protein RnfG
MKDILKLGLILMLFCAIAAFSLAYTNDVTSKVIAENERLAKLAEIEKVFPNAANSEDKTVEGNVGTLVYNEAGELVGVMAQGESNGYGGTILFDLAVNGEGEIVALTNIRHSETPGLGAKITEEGFRNQFTGKTEADAFAVGQDIDAISGATVSSKAMASGVKDSLKNIVTRFLGGE